MDPAHLPLHLGYEEPALYRRFTLRQGALLGPAAVVAFGLFALTVDALPVAGQLLLVAPVLGLAALQALVRREGRSPLGWLLLWLRYLARPRAAVWRPRPARAGGDDRAAAFVAIEPGLLRPAWAAREDRA
jgi:hypothetical protein